MAVVILTRSESLSASHRLHSPHLSDEDNRSLFGKCNNSNGHGHNYKISVSLKGPIDPKTGMAVNLTDLKKWMETALVQVIDHRNLDKDIDFFRERVSTTENLALFCWNQMRAVLPNPKLLYEITIQETEKNSVTYRGE